MARIKTRQEQTTKPPSARLVAVIPSWIPLALAFGGVGFILAPLERWPWAAVGVVLLAVGAYWLHDAQTYDPNERRRVIQLERALLQIGWRDALRVIDPTTRGSQREDTDEAGSQPQDDGSTDSPQRRDVDDGAAGADLDAPLPGEDR